MMLLPVLLLDHIWMMSCDSMLNQSFWCLWLVFCYSPTASCWFHNPGQHGVFQTDRLHGWNMIKVIIVNENYPTHTHIHTHPLKINDWFTPKKGEPCFFSEISSWTPTIEKIGRDIRIFRSFFGGAGWGPTRPSPSETLRTIYQAFRMESLGDLD